MKGKLIKENDKWVVIFKKQLANCFSMSGYIDKLPLHPDDVEQIKKDNLIFDNIEARIAAYPDVDFTIERYCDVHKTGPCTLDCAWDTKQYAKLITVEPKVSDDFQIGPHGAFEYQDAKTTWDEIFEYVESTLHVPLPERLKNWLNNTYLPPVKRIETYDNKQPYQAPEKELCDCGNVATYYYMPSYSGGGNPYHCSDCVPRGCTCNYRYVEHHEAPDGDEGKDWKWIEEGHIWVNLDEKGREYPCAEYTWNNNGFKKD